MTHYTICDRCGEETTQERSWQLAGDDVFVDDLMETLGKTEHYDLCARCHKELIKMIRAFVTTKKPRRFLW